MGGVDVWGEISVDEKRGIAYFPVASAKYELYGGDRKGDNLYADWILALDARTGKHLWHFQTIHHDVWDYDPDAAPQLVTVKHDGKTVDAVALASKNNFLYVLTGSRASRSGRSKSVLFRRAMHRVKSPPRLNLSPP